MIIQQATKALNTHKTADELNTVKLDLNGRRHESSQRHADISEGGRTRRQAIEAGDVEQVRKLDGEARELSAELEVIQGLASKVQTRLSARTRAGVCPPGLFPAGFFSGFTPGGFR
jgi:hypothetical protein